MPYSDTCQIKDCFLQNTNGSLQCYNKDKNYECNRKSIVTEKLKDQERRPTQIR